MVVTHARGLDYDQPSGGLGNFAGGNAHRDFDIAIGVENAIRFIEQSLFAPDLIVCLAVFMEQVEVDALEFVASAFGDLAHVFGEDANHCAVAVFFGPTPSVQFGAGAVR